VTRRPASDRVFFVRMGLLLLALILLGFGGRALTRGEETPPEASVLLPHIACIGAWYLLFVVQAWLIGQRRRGLHRMLGYASLPLSAALLWTSVLVMAANYRLKGDAPLVFFNVLNLSQFAAMYGVAVLRVRDTALHKRLMLYASVAMMPPALVRIIQALGLPEPVTVLLIVGLWVPGFRHDLATRGRVHPGTWIGVGVIAVGVAVGGPIGFSAGWADLVERWIGG
jgi:hypothetical protein